MFLRPAEPLCVAKTSSLDIKPKLFNKIFHACHAYGHNWLYHFMPFSFDLDLGWRSRDQHGSKPLGFISLYTFKLIRMKSDVLFKQFKLNILIQVLSEIQWNKGNNCCFTDCIKKLQGWHVFRHLWINSVQTCYDSRYNWTLHFDTFFKVTRIRDSKTSTPVVALFSIDFDWIWYTVGVMDLILILSHPFNIEGKGP